MRLLLTLMLCGDILLVIALQPEARCRSSRDVQISWYRSRGVQIYLSIDLLVSNLISPVQIVVGCVPGIVGVSHRPWVCPMDRGCVPALFNHVWACPMDRGCVPALFN